MNMKTHSKTASETYAVSTLALLSGWDRRTLKKILKAERGQRFTLEKFCEGLRHHYDGRVLDERMRRAKVGADLLTLQLFKETQALIPVELWQFSFESVLVAARTQFGWMAEKIAHDRRDPALEEVIDREVRALVHSLSKGDLLHPDTPGKLDRDFEQFIENLVKTSPTSTRS